MDSENRPGFLGVPVQVVVQRFVDPALDVVEEEHGFQADAAYERHGFSVRGGLWSNRAARFGDETLGFARLGVEPLNDVDDTVGVFVVLEAPARAHVLTVVEVSAVGGERGFSGVLLPVAPFGELEPAPAADMVHPHLTRPERPGVAVVLPCNDVPAVRTPDRVVQLSFILLRQLFRVRAVRVHDPDILDPVPVARVGNFRPVRAVPGLGFIRRAPREQGRVAAADRDGIDVAEKVEGHRPAVGTDVDGDPSSLVGVERDLGGGTVVGRDIPFPGISP